MKVKIGAATVAVERGDISLIDVDAVVNAANTSLAMGTGVAGALKKRGGVVIEEEAMRLGPVEVGEAVLTTAGNLVATHVIHAAVMGTDLKTDPDTIGKTTRAPHGKKYAKRWERRRRPSRPVTRTGSARNSAMCCFPS